TPNPSPARGEGDRRKAPPPEPSPGVPGEGTRAGFWSVAADGDGEPLAAAGFGLEVGGAEDGEAGAGDGAALGGELGGGGVGGGGGGGGAGEGAGVAWRRSSPDRVSAAAAGGRS